MGTQAETVAGTTGARTRTRRVAPSNGPCPRSSPAASCLLSSPAVGPRPQASRQCRHAAVRALHVEPTGLRFA